MRCVLDPGDAIIDCPPTFTMYVFDAGVNNARVVTVPRLDGFRIDVEGVALPSAGATVWGVPRGQPGNILPPPLKDVGWLRCRHQAGRRPALAADRVSHLAQQPGRQHAQHGGPAGDSAAARAGGPG